MPCILEPEQIAGWCDPELDSTDRIAAYLRPACDGTLETWPVSTRVNNARTADDPGLIEAVATT